MCKYCVARYPMIGRRALAEREFIWENGSIITIEFIGGTSDQHDFVIKHATEWEELSGLTFNFGGPNPMVRISFVEGLGSWSYVGTSCKLVRGATMNFGWLDQAVVKHEFGHLMSLGHEHQHPDGPKWNREVVIKDLSGPPNYWSVAEIEFNVLNSYAIENVIFTGMDPKSIMMYPYPATWTLDGVGTSFNESLSPTDKEFISSIYPQGKQPEDIRKEFAQLLFQEESELRKLKESTLVRLGKQFGLPVDEKYLKVVNREIVWNYLWGNYKKNLCERLASLQNKK